MDIVFGIAIFLFLLAALGAFYVRLFEKWEDKPSAGQVLYYSYGMQLAVAIRRLLSEQDAAVVDVSKWQGVINFIAMRLAGVLGVIIKCGQGRGIDPRFRDNWTMAKSAGLKRGSYWYYDSRVPPKEQAQNWFNWLAGDYGEMPHFADYEETYGGDYRGIENFKIFLAEFQRLTDLPDYMIGVYTGYFYWVANGSRDTLFRRYWLWIAWYSQAHDVVVPAPWTQEDVLFWQYTDLGDGIRLGAESKELDMNWFVKGREVFERMFGVSEPLPVIEPELVNKFVWSTRYSMSLRDAPSINGVRVESYPINTRFLIDRIVPPVSGGLTGDRWGHVVKVNGVTKDLWVAIIHAGAVYCDQSENIDTGTNPRADVVFTDNDGRTFEALDVELRQR